MKKVTIFLGSSIVEMKMERLELENFIRNISDFYEDQYEIRIRPLLCENFDDSVSAVRKQDEYNRTLKSSDYCFFIFFTHAGEFTKEEFREAISTFKHSGKPKVYVYFKVPSDHRIHDSSIEEFQREIDQNYHHYYGLFENLDTIKLRILLALQTYELKKTEPAVKNGNYVLEGGLTFDLSNVGEYKRNSELQGLKAAENVVYSRYQDLKSLSQEIKDNTDLEKRLSAAENECKNLNQEVEQLTKDILSFSQEIVESDQDDGVSARQKKAYRYFELGDYESALKALDDHEIEAELSKSRFSLRKKRQSACRTYIRDYQTKIKIWKATGLPERFKEIDNLYSKIIPLVYKERIEIKALTDYIDYLFEQHRYAAGIKEAEKSLPLIRGNLDQNPDSADTMISYANMVDHIGALHIGEGKFAEAEQLERNALSLFEKIKSGKGLARDDRIAAELLSSITRMNLGSALRGQGKYEEAVEQFRLTIIEHDSNTHIQKHEINHQKGSTYHNWAVTLDNWGKFREAEVKYQLAVDLHTQAVQSNPHPEDQSYCFSLGLTCMLFGEMLLNQQNLLKSKDMLIRADKVFSEMFESNPERMLLHYRYLASYGAKLSVTLNEARQYSDGIDCQKITAKCYDRLADAYPGEEALKRSQAAAYLNLALFYANLSQETDRWEDFKKNLKIAFDYYSELGEFGRQRILDVYNNLKSQGIEVYC